jgi:diguanylate cyclase (GGDEF)-like protein
MPEFLMLATKTDVGVPAPTTDEFKQDVRVRRFLLASAFSVLYLAVLLVFYTQGRIDRGTLVEAHAIVAVLIIVFYAIFRLQLNVRFADPSLTGWQLMAAFSTMLYVLYHAPDTRLAFTPFFFVGLMFGMLRQSDMRLAVLGTIALAGYALVTLLRYARDNDVEMLQLDILQFVVMGATFPWFVYIGSRIRRLQHHLSEVSTRLESIEERARRDDLTGVYNRRALLAAMEESKRKADAAKEPLSICMIDLDLFKRYNDEFDHLTGDHVLRTFAQFVQQGLRASDVFGRYGGEEFVQILRNTTQAGAMADAERLRERVSALEIPGLPSIGPLTVSIGVAQYEPGEAIIRTFARADVAMYRAKALGRNRVAC